MFGPAKKLNARGFTLVEVLISIAIVTILLSLALPSYELYIRKASRADAKSLLIENVQILERYFITNNTYVGGTILVPVVPKGAVGVGIRYQISFSQGPSSSGFIMKAVPVNAQASDTCSVLTVSSTGAQTPSGNGCW